MIYRQLFRYAAVGIASNATLYMTYILITRLGMDHKTAMTLLYVSGVCLTFVFNKNWTFGHEKHTSSVFIRYVSIYALGYVINLSALYLLVDRLGYDHRWVQGVMVIFLAMFLFTLQKMLVFRGQ